MLVFSGLLSDLAAALLFGAGTLCLVRGRFAAEVDVTLTGLGLITLAAMRVLIGDLPTRTPSAETTPVLNVLVLGIGSSLAIALIGGAIQTSGPARSWPWHRPPIGSIAGIIAGAAAIVGVAIVPQLVGLYEFEYQALVVLISLGWLVLALICLRSSGAVNRWLQTFVIMTAAAALARVAVSMVPAAGSGWLILPAALVLSGAVVAIVGTMLDLRELVMDQRTVSATRRQDDERLHEVRSVLAGLHLAASSLTAYEDRIDASTRHRLHTSVTSELARLGQLVDPGPTGAIPVAPVSLVAAIRPVVDASIVQGALVDADIDDSCVLARPLDLAAIVSALLDNARVHAAGTLVELRTIQTDVTVQLEVRDHGPGLPADELAAVFGRGYRGARARRAGISGSGLGLHIARERARSMGGNLSAYSPIDRGAAFILCLPAATAAPRTTANPRPVSVPISVSVTGRQPARA